MGGWVGGGTEFVSLRERIISVSAISHGNRSGAGWIRGGGEEEMDRGRLGFERWEWDGTSIRWEMMLWGKKKFDMKRRRGGCWQEWRVDTWRQAGWWYLQPSDGPDVSPISASPSVIAEWWWPGSHPHTEEELHLTFATSLVHLASYHSEDAGRDWNKYKMIQRNCMNVLFPKNSSFHF